MKSEESGSEKQPSAIIFVPRTKDGKLTTFIKEKEEQLNKISLNRVKVIEKNGSRLEHLLIRADPWGEE